MLANSGISSSGEANSVARRGGEGRVVAVGDTMSLWAETEVETDRPGGE